MKKTRQTKDELEPFERRGDWLRLTGSAWMGVSVSGGPIHDPHKSVLQLFVVPWKGDLESWTVYRHKGDARKDGKIVFKKWDQEKDRERFRTLGEKEAPMEWRNSPKIVEREFSVPGRWVKDLELKVEALRVPPITGEVIPLSRSTHYRLRFWRGRQESQFEWRPTAPKEWRPLSDLFHPLLRAFREHARGKTLVAVVEL